MGDAGAGAGEGYESVDAAEGPTTFGSRPFSADELHRIQQGLMKKLPRSCLSERSAGAGGKVSYIEGHRVIDHANQVLGFDGWSSSLLSLTQDYVRARRGDVRPAPLPTDTNARILPFVPQCDVNNERYSLCFTAIVRVQLKDGTFHEDVGCGLSEGQRSRGQALEKAKKVRSGRVRSHAVMGLTDVTLNTGSGHRRHQTGPALLWQLLGQQRVRPQARAERAAAADQRDGRQRDHPRARQLVHPDLHSHRPRGASNRRGGARSCDAGRGAARRQQRRAGRRRRPAARPATATAVPRPQWPGSRP